MASSSSCSAWSKAGERGRGVVGAAAVVDGGPVLAVELLDPLAVDVAVRSSFPAQATNSTVASTTAGTDLRTAPPRSAPCCPPAPGLSSTPRPGELASEP